MIILETQKNEIVKPRTVWLRDTDYKVLQHKAKQVSSALNKKVTISAFLRLKILGLKEEDEGNDNK